MNVAVVVNPAARAGAHTHAATKAVHRLREHGHTVTVISGGSAGETSALIRAYVAETQLAQVHLGSEAQIAVDAGAGALRTFTGKVTWISSQAEFTPTPIQTREERADLVYAIKIRVGNEQGVLKVGMPADVHFAAGATP